MLSAVRPSARGYPAMPLPRQLAHQRCVHPGPLVLGAAPATSHTPVADRDRTVSRRSEPSSRTAFMGEQPNPWDLLRPQDATSRHRGAKPCRRCGLLGRISLLSRAWLLSVKPRPVTRHRGITRPDFRPCSACPPAVKLPCCPCALRPIAIRPEEPLGASVTLWEATAPVKLPTSRGPRRRCQRVRTTAPPGWYFKDASPRAGAPGSPAPTYPTQPRPRPTTSWSKAPRVFVLPRVDGIFTVIPIRRVPCRDSAQIVLPFVRVGTYPTRNFATLGPL